jgi:hypothetical protein
VATLGEYGSLLQLGFGIGVGLSVFRAPMDLLSAKAKADIRSEMDVLANVQTAKANEKKARLSDLNLEFVKTAATLDKFHLPFMIASILGALVNWALLAAASHEAGRVLSPGEEWFVFFVSGPIYLIISAILALVTWQRLRPVQVNLEEIRSR